MCSVQEKSSGRSAHYKLTSTVMLWLQTTKSGSGTMNLGGSLTRQVWCSATQVTDDVFWELRRLETLQISLQTERDETVGESSPHIANIGRLVEVSWAAKYMFLFILTVRSAEITWTRLLRVSCFCVSVQFTVSVVWEESRWQMEAWIEGIKNIFILLTGYGEQDSLHTEWNLLWEN